MGGGCKEEETGGGTPSEQRTNSSLKTLFLKSVKSLLQQQLVGEACPSLVTSLVISTAGDVYCFHHTCQQLSFTYVNGGVTGRDVTSLGKPVLCSARGAVWENWG